jgi:V-type H+-transporting ATPase subunit E
MEAEVSIRCRKSDLPHVREIIAPAMEEYKHIMKREVKAFEHRDVPIAVKIDETKYLPEFDPNEATDSCMGGLLLHSRRGRIVCSNTLDERLSLCYQEAIPDIRRLLFPSFQQHH